MNKLFLKASILMLTLSCSFITNAQKSDSTVTIIFAGEKNKGGNYTSKKKKVDANNIIKIAPTGIFVGQIPLIYERKLTSSISIQVAAGLTNQNYVRSAFMKANDRSPITEYPDNFPMYSSDESEKLYSFNTRKAEMGTMFSIQPKFYLNDDALDDSYIAFSYNLYNYKFSMPKGSYDAFTGFKFNGPAQSESEKITDFMLHFGSQNINGHFSLEYSTAVGLRKVEGTKYVATRDGTGGSYDGFANYKQTLFNYELAIRVGYVF